MSSCGATSPRTGTLAELGDYWLRGLRREIPLVAERVAHSRAALAVGLQRRLLHRRRARRERAAIPGVHVVDVDIEHRRHGLPLVVGVAHLDDRAAHANLGVQD